MQAVTAYVEQAAVPLAGLYKAARLEKAMLTIHWQSPILHLHTPQTGQFRSIVKAMSVDVLHVAELGQVEAAGEKLIGLYRCASAFDTDSMIFILFLNRLALDAMARNQTERVLNTCGIEAAVLDRIQIALREDALATSALTNVYQTERVILTEALLLPDGVQQLLPHYQSISPVLEYTPVIKALDGAAVLDMVHDLIEVARGPEHEMLPALRAVGHEADQLPAVYAITRGLSGSFVIAPEYLFRGIGLTRAMQAALACEQYRLAEGRWPSELAAVVPRFLPAVPLDPFDGKPIRFAVIPEGIKTWSIGPNLVDGGGNVGRLSHTSTLTSSDAGWIILNPDLRGKKLPDPAP